ncbi:MAG: hypothetical protein AB1603_06240 [Chloroflexota bacterium]
MSLYRATALPSLDLDWLRQGVAGMLAGNRVVRRDGSGRAVRYHAPSLVPEPSLALRGRYPHQWFWDSCAHAVVLSHLDPEMARGELLGLLSAQDEQGFIPHQIFNTGKMHFLDRLLARFYPSRYGSPYLQPPALAEAVEAVYRREPDLDFLRRVLPAVRRYYWYIRKTRVRGGDGLAEIVHSYESGKDRSREYDEVYGRPLGLGLRLAPLMRLMMQQRALDWDLERIFSSNLFRVKDLLFNCVYARNLEVMSGLCRAASEQGQAQEFAAESRRVEGAILEKMWDAEAGLFCSLDARGGVDRRLKVSTVSAFLPLMLSSTSEATVERLVEEHLGNPAEYWLEYPVPAEPLGSPEAGHRLTAIWRGLQTWMYPNWFIVRGLLRQARRFPRHAERHVGMARHITERSYELVRRSGFREYYHARTGQGARARRFGSSALVLDMAYCIEGVTHG